MATNGPERRVDLYNSTYGGFQERVREKIRRETYGEDIGQIGWLLAEEAREFIGWLGVDASSAVLEVASGSGGPALFMARTTGARVVGIDINEHGVVNANEMARAQGLDAQVRFRLVDGSRALPFDDASFDAVVCIDSINHLPGRLGVLKEWHRVLRPGGRLLYTDPIVVTGLITREEIATRSSIGYFLFAPPGENERLLAEAGFTLLRAENRTASVVQVARRWYDSRLAHRDELARIEGDATYDGLQRFLAVVHTLASEGRLSRFVYLAAH